MTRVVAVVPCHNEENSIAAVVKEAKRWCSPVVVCDDRSTDDSKDRALNAGAMVCHNREATKGAGTMTRIGIVLALRLGADVIVTLDGDGQHDPSSIPALLAKLTDDVDVVIGTRDITRANTPFLRWLGNVIFRSMRNTGNSVKLQDAESGFRAFRVSVFQDIEIETAHFGFAEEVAIKLRAKKHKITEVTVKTIYGADLHKYSFRQQMKRGVEVPYTIIKWRWLAEWKPALRKRLHWQF